MSNWLDQVTAGCKPLSLSCRDLHDSIHTLPTSHTRVTTFVNPTDVNCDRTSPEQAGTSLQQIQAIREVQITPVCTGRAWLIEQHLCAFRCIPQPGTYGVKFSAHRHPVRSCRMHPANRCPPGRRQGTIKLGIVRLRGRHACCELSLNIAWRWGGRGRHQICLGIRTYLSFLLGSLPSPAPVGPLFPTSELAPLPAEHKGDG